MGTLKRESRQMNQMVRRLDKAPGSTHAHRATSRTACTHGTASGSHAIMFATLGVYPVFTQCLPNVYP
eukprot:1770765-Alexandrium_andersonii.AAC.1